MDLFSLLSPSLILFACAAAALAGTIKGVVGFAMPMILISSLGSFLAPEVALAGLILPTLVSNWLQVLRYDPREAWRAVVRFRVFLGVGGGVLLLSAQLVTALPDKVMVGVIGGAVTLFAVIQLLGWAPARIVPSTRIEAGVGAFAGFVGGVSGIWGPPTVAYLTALGTEKRDQMRVQGVIYGLGAVALVFAHVGSGVLNAATWPLSALLVLPAAAGMWVGGRIQDRIDQAAFRKVTLAVLLVAGLNLLRRALIG